MKGIRGWSSISCPCLSSWNCSPWLYYCLRPKAKDLGISWVVVLVKLWKWTNFGQGWQIFLNQTLNFYDHLQIYQCRRTGYSSWRTLTWRGPSSSRAVRLCRRSPDSSWWRSRRRDLAGFPLPWNQTSSSFPWWRLGCSSPGVNTLKLVYIATGGWAPRYIAAKFWCTTLMGGYLTSQISTTGLGT